MQAGVRPMDPGDEMAMVAHALGATVSVDNAGTTTFRVEIPQRADQSGSGEPR